LKDVIEKSRDRQGFEVEDALAVRVGDLQELLHRHRPQIVHFCGHGSGQQGLVFEGNDEGEQWVRAEALSDLFRLFAENVGCVLLNACYSEEQANAIVNHIDYVIGMNQEIRDDAAIAFSKGFYRALGYECSIEQAYEFGKNAIQLEISGSSKMRSAATEEVVRKAEVVDTIQTTAIPEHLKPILKIKPTLTSSSRANITAPEQPLSQETRVAVQLDIDQSLKADTKVKLKTFEFQVPTVNIGSTTIEKPGLFGKKTETITTLNITYQRGDADYFVEDLGSGVRLEMVPIPRGTFMMGSPSPETKLRRAANEGPQHQMSVQPFFMGKTTVTQAQWQAIAALPKVQFDLNPDPSRFKGNDRPVERVSWHEAVEFCDRLTQRMGRQYRLPSEAEWEYACRAGTTTPFYCGETITTDLANYDGNSTIVAGVTGVYQQQTTNVGSFPPNAFGLYSRRHKR